jgi:hypothetical protein
MNKTLVRTHKVLAAYISIGTFVQMFLAGIWHAEVVSTPDAHVFFGLSMLLAALIALIIAAVGRFPRAILGRTALLFVLILLQPILIEARRNGLPLLSALHTLNAAFIGVVGGMVAAKSGSMQTVDSDEAVVTAVAGD